VQVLVGVPRQATLLARRSDDDGVQVAASSLSASRTSSPVGHNAQLCTVCPVLLSCLPSWLDQLPLLRRLHNSSLRSTRTRSPSCGFVSLCLSNLITCRSQRSVGQACPRCCLPIEHLHSVPSTALVPPVMAGPAAPAPPPSQLEFASSLSASRTSSPVGHNAQLARHAHAVACLGTPTSVGLAGDRAPAQCAQYCSRASRHGWTSCPCSAAFTPSCGFVSLCLSNLITCRSQRSVGQACPRCCLPGHSIVTSSG
jgi:hypothetical protein